jgi:dipeptide/tripeptide permease
MKNIFTKFPKTFWVANTAELFERLAWYGFYMLFATYLTQSTDTGALGFSQEEKGWIMGIGTALLYALPIITGTIADKFGYKKILLLSFAIYMSGFLLLGKVTGFYSVFSVFLYIAVGGALFKPIISATIAKTTTKETSSIGFGIFYMMVNMGSFIGPLFTTKLREISWYSVFVFTAGVFIINIILIYFFYKEPEREQSKNDVLTDIKISLKNIKIALADYKFVIFLVLIIGFWAMYYQLFFSLPVFINQWVDTSILFNKIHELSPVLADLIGTAQGTIEAEKLTNIDAFYIIIFQVFISTIVMKLRPLNAMITGILIASIGIGLMFISMNSIYLVFSILIFSVGEMSSSPKITEYIGRIAPKDKVALYMGMSFLPVAGGSFFAGILSGNVYGSISDKINIMKTEAAVRALNLPEISEKYTQTNFISDFLAKTGMNASELNTFLWDKYHPQNILFIFAGIGFITAIGLFLYDRFLIKNK